MFKRMNLKVRLIALFLLVGLVPLLVSSFLSYQQAATNIQEEVLLGLELYLEAEKELLELSNLDRERGVIALASYPLIYESLAALKGVEAGQDAAALWLEREEMVTELLVEKVEAYGYDFIFITDSTGLVIYSTQEGVLGADFSGRAYIQGSLAGAVSWSPLFFCEVADESVLVVSAPVSERGKEGEVVGTVNLVPSDMQMVQMIHHGLERISATADAYLIDADGLLLTNTRLPGEFQEGAALNKSIDTKAVELLAGPIARADFDFITSSEHLNH
ncbi:hypothetical protein LR013_01100 [candidate division NPL-UPA2 bacterium]|nr:hypothetical protein [candidate division NPL-UPA2 bacterium]